MHFIIAQSFGDPTLIHSLNGNLISNPKVVMEITCSKSQLKDHLFVFFVAFNHFFKDKINLPEF